MLGGIYDNKSLKVNDNENIRKQTKGGVDDV